MLKVLICSTAMAVACLVTTTTVSATESHPCASVVDPNERLACYDEAFPPAVNARAAETSEAKRARQLQEFGLSGVQQRARETEQEREARPDQIEAKISTIYSSSTGERIVTLENGQLWMLTEVSTKGYLRIGDTVVIRKAAMGSFMLVTPGKIALRAKRIQ